MQPSSISFSRLAQGGLQAFGLALTLNVVIFYLSAGLHLYALDSRDFTTIAGVPIWLGAVVLATALATGLATMTAWVVALSARRPATRFGRMTLWFGLLSLAIPAALFARWPLGVCLMLAILHLATTMAIRFIMPTAIRRSKRLLHGGFEEDSV